VLLISSDYTYVSYINLKIVYYDLLVYQDYTWMDYWYLKSTHVWVIDILRLYIYVVILSCEHLLVICNYELYIKDMPGIL
jgi:hypothetical protein